MDGQVFEKLEKFFGQFRVKTFKKGEVLIRADEPPRAVYFLKDGLVKMYIITKKGDELLLNIFKAPSFFPMSWAINDTKNNYYYEAMVESQVVVAPRNKVVEFIKQNNDVLYDLLGRTYRGVDGLLTRMSYVMSGEAYSRLISEIIIQARRFGVKEKNGSVVFKISEKDLAEETGMTRETVSRELKILKQKKLVALDKKMLTIKHFNLLEQELM